MCSGDYRGFGGLLYSASETIYSSTAAYKYRGTEMKGEVEVESTNLLAAVDTGKRTLWRGPLLSTVNRIR